MNDTFFIILFIGALILFFVGGSYIAKFFHLDSYVKEPQRKTIKKAKSNIEPT